MFIMQNMNSRGISAFEPNLGPIFLQRLSADDTSKQVYFTNFTLLMHIPVSDVINVFDLH